MLLLLSNLAAVSSAIWKNAKDTTEFVVLRLALLDMEGAAPEFSSSRKAQIIQQKFDKNLELFKKNPRLRVEVPEKLQTRPLGALSATELHELRGILRSGWE